MPRATARASELDSDRPATASRYRWTRPLALDDPDARIAASTASSNRISLACVSQLSSIACSWSPVLPARSAASISSFSGCRDGFVLPWMKAWSRGSMVVVMSVAASASVRAMARRSEPRVQGVALVS